MIMDIRCQETGEWRSVYQGPLCIASIRKQTWDEVQSGTCSINVLEAGNLSSVKRLTFWARGDQGGEIVTFSVGSGGASPKPRSLGRVTLTPRWEPYEIDLEDVDLTNAIILFLWHATDADNPQGAIFYLDDVQFEGKKEAKQPLQSTGQNLADLFTRLCWIAYSPTHFDPTTTPIQWPSEEDVREDLYVLRNAGFNGLVTYRANYTNQDTPDQMLDIPQLAEEVGFEGMIVGVWDPTDEDELRTAEQAGLHPIVVGYSTGNEGLDVRYDLETLASALDRLRRTTGKPVSTTEEVHDYYENSPLWNISDWIFPNVHPYFSGYRDAQEAVAWTEKIFETLESVSDKPLIFKEVGLPSGGDTDLDETGQAQYYRLLRETRITYVVFEAFDAPWKHLGQPEPDGTYPLPDPEPHWGIFTSDRVPKEAVKSICPIRSVGLEQR
jgi:exo-beta-1,3-glucanase (GH17 family)